MADGRDPTRRPAPGPRYPWTEIFRCFQIALDPRKLFVAALGILVMSFRWWLLSAIFYYKAPDPQRRRIPATRKSRKTSRGRTTLRPASPTRTTSSRPPSRPRSTKRKASDQAQWQVLDSAGRPRRAAPDHAVVRVPRARTRSCSSPTLIGSPAVDRGERSQRAISDGRSRCCSSRWSSCSCRSPRSISPGRQPADPVLPVPASCSATSRSGRSAAASSPGIAAVQLANKGPITLRQAVRFVCQAVPRATCVLAAGPARRSSPSCVVGLIVYGILGLIPFVGDLVMLGLGLPLVILGGASMAVFLVGLVGYPLMYPTLSAEGDQSDTFDALSRSINYVVPVAVALHLVLARGGRSTGRRSRSSCCSSRR